MSERLFVDRLAQVIRQADGDHTMGAGALADAIADSGILWELEQKAFNRGYHAARELDSQVTDEEQSE